MLILYDQVTIYLVFFFQMNLKMNLNWTKSVHKESSQSSEESEIKQSPNSNATADLLYSKKSDDHKIDRTLSPYTGSKKWRFWFNRFESMAKLANWDFPSKEKLQHLCLGSRKMQLTLSFVNSRRKLSPAIKLQWQKLRSDLEHQKTRKSIKPSLTTKYKKEEEVLKNICRSYVCTFSVILLPVWNLQFHCVK